MDAKHWLSRAVVRAFIGLGTMSYSIYLLHGKLQFLSMQLSSQVFDSHSIAFDVAALALSLALCVPFFYFCERPFIGKPLKTSKQAAHCAALPETPLSASQA